MTFRLAALLILGTLLSACATARFDTSIDAYGIRDEAQRDALALKARQMPWDQQYDVDAQIGGELPEGLVWDSETHELRAIDERFEVVGRVTSQHLDSITQLGKSLFRNPDFHDDVGSFRRTACTAQMAIKAPAGALWSVLPFNWICVPATPHGEENYRLHVQELRRNAAVLEAEAIFVERANELAVDPTLFDDRRVVGYAVKRRPAFLSRNRDAPTATTPPRRK